MTRAPLPPRLRSSLPRWLSLCLLLLAALCLASPAAASPKAASKHFMRGVGLYNEADYRAALVEFKRAYELAPNPSVLFNIGQTYFQLQNYAAALTTFERYLSESGPSAGHRAEVEQSLETLRTRVGKLSLTSNVPGVEIAIDDEPIGQTPFDKPLLVSIGRRKVVATLEGQASQTKVVEIAAGDTERLALVFAGGAGAATGAPGGGDPPVPERPPSAGRIRMGWIATGTLAAGAVAMGVLAFTASSKLDDMRGEFPADRAALDDQASRTTLFTVSADVLGAAAIVTGGITLYFSMKRSRMRGQELRAGVSPRGLLLSGTF